MEVAKIDSKEMPDTTLFEVSWEICNKVGGIHTVVSTKILEVQESFGDNYYLLGPELGSNSEFEETNEACFEPIKQALSMRNLSCRFGRWKVPGNPKVILVNFKERYNPGQLLYDLWTRYGVDSLTGSWDYVEPVMFSTACGEVISAIYQTQVEPALGKAVAHFHEWMCGAGLLMVKRLTPDIGTIFTTHATVLGRSMAGSGVDIYQQMYHITPSREAGAYNVTAKCSMEAVSAREADCFTTVSDITAEEASIFLNTAPDIVTPNGLDLRVIPDFSKDRQRAKEYRKKLLTAVQKLLRHDLPEQTRIMVISGRYEFHNKGVDVFLDALAQINSDLQQTPVHILALCLVMGGHSGVNADAISGDPNIRPDNATDQRGFITSHHVYDQPNDPILNACHRLKLLNTPDNHVQVVFVPSLLDGKDGFLNMSYDDVLAACDLGVFPSWYEPWGYTPQESAARAVPTVTTDLSGFGLWSRDVQEKHGGNSGVGIVPRRQKSYEETVASLRLELLDYASCSEEVLQAKREAVRALSSFCSWKEFFPYYIQAYKLALEETAERIQAHLEESKPMGLTRILTGTASTTPSLHKVTAVAALPESLSRLRELAYNLWWAWSPDAWQLFSTLDAGNWENNNHNPVQLIEEMDSMRLDELSKDPTFLRLYEKVMLELDVYLAKPSNVTNEYISSQRPIAYFSTEYGINECLPIYSGGLGVLSGDHLKSSSDLNIPLVGIGLLYRSGYFKQQIDRDGRQVAIYPENDFSLLPVERVKDKHGNLLNIELDLPGRKLHAQIWIVKVGRISLYLMDTDTPKNTDDDRKITARLYEADRDYRLRQEILLGMGGVRLLQALQIEPAMYHMNEGHSAFLILERIHGLMAGGLDFASAGELVRNSCVFTTHTPVDAGNERFSVDLMERYFSSFASGLGLAWSDFLRMGKLDETGRSVFEMTVLALKYSYGANGVSRLHGYVSRYMWRQNWKGVPVSEVPIGHVTNGIHVPSYAGPSIRPLLDRYLGSGWMELPPESPIWEKISDIPNGYLLAAKQHQKVELLDKIRAGLPSTFEKFGTPRTLQKEIMARLVPQALIIGFARRFAPYKRATLLFADPDRLHRIISQANRPVIFVFSGKAHPADIQGVDIMQEVIRYTQDPRFAGHVFFVEDYSLAVSRQLVQGCDVWLNTPRRPYEASGTSGQKVPVNAGLNLSVSDGWWCEGYNGHNGWTIGPVVAQILPSDQQNDYADAESLYTLLEEQVIPLFFDHDMAGIPHLWLNEAKKSMKSLTSQFSSNRMVSDYFEQCYQPCAERYAKVLAENMALAKRLASWKQDVQARFGSLSFDELRIDGMDDETLTCGQPIRVTAKLRVGSMQLEELLAQLVIGPGDGTDFVEQPDVVELKGKRHGEGLISFTGTYTAVRNGRYAYGVRVMPITASVNPLDSGLVIWG